MPRSAIRHHDHPSVSLRLLYLIFVRLCGWLVMLGRRAQLLSLANQGHGDSMEPRSSHDVSRLAASPRDGGGHGLREANQY